MGCIESVGYEVIMRDATFEDCRAYIKAHCPEYREVKPGFRLFEKHVIGIPPILIGLDGDTLIFPYTKPCYGTFLLRSVCPEEAAYVRSQKK